MAFRKVDAKADFSKQEEEILSFWDKEKIFEKSLELRKDAKRYVFFEGPPTANAKPGLHHALARYFKDLFPRYKTMRGFLVERKAGWDTHGLPVEIAVEKELGISTKPEIEKYGVEKFNAKARQSAWEYKEDWEKFTRRSGFWLDLECPYITYDADYIESVWAILKKAWDDKLIYQGYRVVPRCPRCGTTLSSHEVAQGYKEIEETSIYVKFKLKAVSGQRSAVGGDTYILAWTTTPWTLPGHVALAVGKNIAYVKLKIKNDPPTPEASEWAGKLKVQEGDFYILAEELIQKVFGDEKVEIVERYKGKDLVGMEYEPLFAEAIPKTTENYQNAFKVYPADFVTLEDGTGVVHTAVMYGEDDYNLGEKVGLPKFHTVLPDGKFGPTVAKWAGRFVKNKETEAEIVADLKERGLLFKEMAYKHDYPFCWRCETPLLYYASESWFIAMTKLRDKMLKSNQKINWVPDYFKEGRFGEWLREIKDWGISRERYWGTPLPFWMSADGDSFCVGSFEELRQYQAASIKYQAGGKKPDTSNLIPDTNWDPHKPFVDDIVLVKDGKEYKRVPEVLDVWFDSGSMPFAQWHYPFENKERIDPSAGSGQISGSSYPADFISEAVDQTRGWFYTLLAVATLMDKEAPYKNVICLGHIMDKNGKKMSKSKGNVVDPWKIFDTYGSDPLRWYLYTINQPGLPKNFDEEGVKQVVRRFMLTLWNTYSFFVTYANIDNFVLSDKQTVVPKNILDQWIWARRNQLVEQVSKELDGYNPMQACLAIEAFVDDLSNWYVRRSRRRFWRTVRHSLGDGGKGENDADKQQAYIVLYSVLMDMTKLLAPFMPFLAETMYSNLKLDKEPISVHLTDWPSSVLLDSRTTDEQAQGDDKILVQMKLLRELVENGLNQREQASIKVRQPLAKFTVSASLADLPEVLEEILKDELNVKMIERGKENKLDIKLTPQLQSEGLAREIVRAIQVLRKEGGLEITDRIKLLWNSSAGEVKQAVKEFEDYIKTEVLADELSEGEGQEHAINGFMVKLKVTKN